MAENQPVDFNHALLAQIPGFEKAKGRIFRTPLGNAVVTFRKDEAVITLADGAEVVLTREQVAALL